MKCYLIEHENRKTGERSHMTIMARSAKQAKFFFNSNEERRFREKIVSVEHLPTNVGQKGNNGDFDDSGVWSGEYHYNRKKERGLF